MGSQLSPASQGAIIATAFFIPVFTYLAYTRIANAPKSTRTARPSKSTGPLPSPTEITQICIYPIKSCHGISLPSAKLLPTGLDLDRQWMWVTESDYKFLTIRNLAKMTLIRPSYNASTDTLTVTAPSPNPGDQDLAFEIPAHPSKEWLAENTEVVPATVWSTTTQAHAYSKELTGAFDAFFGNSVRLVYKSPYSDSPRPLVSNGAKEILGRAASTCWADLMPVLVASEASINELNSRLEVTEDGLSIPITRFRPNIIVRGHEAWAEDSWMTLKIGNLVMDVTQRCARCRVPNVDSETGEEHKKQPWDMLMKYRRVDEGITYKPCFGMLCVPRGEGGKVEVGGVLEVLETTEEHRYVPGM